MKIVGNAILSSREVNGKRIHYIKIREYDRNGEYKEAELFCRLTKKAQDLVDLKETNDLSIDIKESFYSVDNYFKGEQKYTKPTLVISEIEIV